MSPSPRGARSTDATAIADLVRRAFAAQSRPTNPPASALKETAPRSPITRRRGLGLLHLGTRLVLDDNRRLFRSCGFEETTLHSHEGFDEPTWVQMHFAPGRDDLWHRSDENDRVKPRN